MYMDAIRHGAGVLIRVHLGMTLGTLYGCTWKRIPSALGGEAALGCIWGCT